jgi:phosphodiesterase/alkaline phosphatase D-like protein
MPVREPSAPELSDELYRSYSFGDLLTLVTMETRITARAAPLIIDDYTKDMNGPQDAEHFRRDILGAPGRHMIDGKQTDFIVDAFTQSKAAGQPWRLLGNQVPMGKLHTPDLTPHVVEESILALEKDWPGVRDFVKSSIYGLPVYADSWDGYPWAREQFYEALSAAGLTDTFVLTGDAHEYWVNNLTTDAGNKMGVEISTTSITSPTVRTYFKGATEDYSLLMTQSNPDVRYYNAMHNGYLDITVTHKKVSADCITVDTILSRDYSARAMAKFTVKKDGESLKVTRPRGLNLKQRALFSGLG